MSHRIPPQIIEQVLDLSLNGLSVREIVKSVGKSDVLCDVLSDGKPDRISVGSVHSLLQEFARNDPNYHLLRTLAVNLRKNGSDVWEYAWLVRLRNVLQIAGASLTEVEKIITEVPVYCYKTGISVEILVDQLRKFKDYTEANPADPGQCNVIIESYRKSIEFYDKYIQRHEADVVHKDETYNEDKLKDMLEIILTDDKVQELNEGHLGELTKQEVLERIIDVIKSPSDYDELFFRPAKIASSSFQSTQALPTIPFSKSYGVPEEQFKLSCPAGEHVTILSKITQ
jgi:hypothetical protein